MWLEMILWSPAKAGGRWSECHVIITGHDCFFTSPLKSQCTHIASRAALKYYSCISFNGCRTVRYKNIHFCFSILRVTEEESKSASIWLISNVFWRFIHRNRWRFSLVLLLLSKNTSFTIPLTNDTHIRTCWPGTLSQWDCSIWYHQSKACLREVESPYTVIITP